MHESCRALVLNWLDPCVSLCFLGCVFFASEYIGIGDILGYVWLYIRELCLPDVVYFLCVNVYVCLRPEVPELGSLSAAGKLKCHDLLPAALGLLLLFVPGWLLI